MITTIYERFFCQRLPFGATHFYRKAGRNEKLLITDFIVFYCIYYYYRGLYNQLHSNASSIAALASLHSDLKSGSRMSSRRKKIDKLKALLNELL